MNDTDDRWKLIRLCKNCICWCK